MEKQRIIDFHTHIYPGNLADRAVDSVSSFYNIPMQGQGIMEDMKSGATLYDVRGYVVHLVATSPSQVQNINSFGRGIITPGVFVFASLHPNYDDNINEIDKIAKFGFSGVKLHPDFQKFNIDEPSMFPVYEKLEALGLPLLMHMGDERYDFSRPYRLAKVLDTFPGLRVIAAHMGGYSRWDEVEQYLAGRNLFFDTSSTLWSLGIKGCAKLINLHGADRVVFGSDYPVTTIDKEMDLFNKMELSEDDRQKILYKNAAAILGLEG